MPLEFMKSVRADLIYVLMSEVLGNLEMTLFEI